MPADQPGVKQDSETFQGPFGNQPGLSDRFEVISALGDGAAGFVYRVRDRERGNKEVALKVLANDLAFDEATLERFMAELKICQHLRHTNVVEAYDLIQLGDTVAYTMEFIDGGSLQSIFVKRKIGYDAIDRIFEQVLDGVQALHERNLVHRDIKLENVLVGTNGVVKLTDLGLMKQLGKKGLTKPGILLGTPQYMPPEYVRESRYDERGDIYTLGLMLYELLTGKRWLSHLSGQEVITHLLKTKFQISRESLVGIPRKYLRVLTRALDARPDYRYQSAMEMKRDFSEDMDLGVESTIDLKDAAILQKVRSSERVIDQPKRGPVWFMVVAGLMVGLIMVAGFILVNAP
jgi:serine/threonine protein kinase